jgi:hypothetical protein
MKKLMMTLAAGLFATAVVAEVTSANVVGYQTITLTNGYNMLAVNFATPGAPAAAMLINDLLPSGSNKVTAAGLTGKTTPTGADQVRVWNVSGAYENYFLFRNALVPTNTKNYLWCSATSPYPVATNTTFKTGDALWFTFVGTKTTFTFAGEVPNNVAQTKTLVAGYNMLGAGFAADWDLNAIGTNVWSGADFTGKTTPTGADQVRVWKTDTQSYKDYFLFRNSLVPTNTKNFKWCSSVSPYPVTTGADIIPMASAVWFIKAKAGTCQFAPQIPYTLQ